MRLFFGLELFLYIGFLCLLKVDGDTSTNDCVIALASGSSGSKMVSSLESYEGCELQDCLDAVSSLLDIVFSMMIVLCPVNL